MQVNGLVQRVADGSTISSRASPGRSFSWISMKLLAAGVVFSAGS
jgi:hypothetical protein